MTIVLVHSVCRHYFLMLSSSLGVGAQYSKGTYIPVFPTADRQSVWRGQILDSSDNVVTMGITPAPNCIVGQYRVYVAVITPFGIRRTNRDPSLDTYIIFNPWSRGQELALMLYEADPFVVVQSQVFPCLNMLHAM